MDPSEPWAQLLPTHRPLPVFTPFNPSGKVRACQWHPLFLAWHILHGLTQQHACKCQLNISSAAVHGVSRASLLDQLAAAVVLCQFKVDSLLTC